ncbi:hypothetical protein PG996_005884 [Apiospora saccharicola]|uniref:C2H2-type domain-containing protein n=1 Tax=Apiospora saccharicola TaxID=335842 RepID=A0ABR1VMQ9_9PEZI
MAAVSSDEYEPSSTDEDGHSRPNRWDGPASTWQDMASQEIATSVALEEIRNRDLAVHLYNAFALKRQDGASRAPAPELVSFFFSIGLNMSIMAYLGHTGYQCSDGRGHSGESMETPRQLVRMAHAGRHCAPDDFMKRPEDRDDGFTVRRPITGAEGAASFALEEAVSATALRLAKEKFQARPWQDDDMIMAAPDDTDGKEEGHEALDESGSDGVSGSRPGSKGALLKKEEQFGSDLDSASSDGASGSLPPGPRYFKPVVSADDALSYDLLRPSTRHILSKLDVALMVLHKSRKAVVSYVSESESESSIASDTTTRSAQQEKRGPGRPAKSALAMRLKRAQSKEAEDPGAMSRGEDETKGTQPKKARGRPKKQYPRLPGETDKQYAIRVARLRKEPRPVFSDDSETGIEPQSDASELKAKRRPTAPRRKAAASASRDPSSDRSAGTAGGSKNKRRRHNLRDWRDVLGAAAVAGFSQPALDRAARRCADLFGGPALELRTMDEDPAVPDKLLQYAPGMELPTTAQLLHQELADEEEDIAEDRRRRGRSSSVVSDSRAPSRSRARSGSVSSIGGVQFLCTVEGCPKGFTRNANLLRHLRQVHNLRSDNMRPMDIDSEDEMMGAVHVDGFLRPIKARRGWRGDAHRASTASPEKKRRGRPGKRGGPKSSERVQSDDSSMDGL